MVQVVISGRIPSKKNSRISMVRGGKIINIPSNDFRKWHKEASKYLVGVRPLNIVKSISLMFFMPDNRRTDLTNKAESVMDLLVDGGIISDDSWQVIKKVELESMGIDKENPRVEISILGE